jgi:predicted metal-dependent hydrolase
MSPGACAPDPRLRQGVADFNAGAFYEAHEHFEELWNDSEGTARRLCQALVQLAAGYHKLELGVPGGAVKLLTRALGILDDLPVGALPQSLAELRPTIRNHLAALRAAPDGAIAPPRLALDALP